MALQAGKAPIAPPFSEKNWEQEKFRLAFEAAPMGMILVNPAGVIELANVEMKRISGYEIEELVGMTVENIVPHSVREVHPTHRKHYDRDPKQKTMGKGRDLFLLHRSQNLVPVEIGLNSLETSKGRIFLCSIVDITERKRVFDQKQSVVEEMEQFVYTLSHDLRSPLVTIKGFAAAIHEDLKAGDWKEVGSFLDRIDSAANRMNSLITDLLNLSRAGIAPLDIQDCRIPNMVQEVMDTLQTPLRSSGLQVHLYENFPVIKADPYKLTLVIQNLLENVLKHGINPHNPQLEIGWQQNGTFLECFFKDNGPGIPSEIHDKIFLVFQRGNTSSTGTGIGLTLAKKILERHDGAIWVESEIGNGACFWLKFPNPA